ncbi:peptidyl-Lys metalloendopeptidase [Rhizoctonia solani]|uniref:Peptidyl-Lys metalloendopeptidase n=1 Tax=Rhizoctonia solani TaxID=456999 RepID=A0A0K6G2V5_9AGAM|nr:unnamed protein product [Rhizoctonia solani]CUA72582.1 peptidyl-Lys metalloendopeptidase [Rhizoctonia solani]
MRILFSSVLAVAYGVSVCSAGEPALSVLLSVPKSARSIEDLSVTTTVKNTGSETLKLLNDPRTVLSTAQTKTFIITKDNDGPEFTGMVVKYSPQHALKNNIPEHFTVLAPGESCQRTHSLAGAYNFTRAGPGEFKIDAYNHFHHADGSGKLIQIDATTQSAKFVLSGGLVSVRKTHRNSLHPVKRQGVMTVGCSDVQASTILSAASQAEKYAAATSDYMKTLTTGSPRYISWFGAWDTQRAATVASHYANIVGKASVASYDCAPANCEPNDYAYVFPDQAFYINLCGAFWQSTGTGTDSQGGTIIHELSHFTVNGGTTDTQYGQEGCLALAKSDPASAIMNADSHQYFAENNPAQQ